jgi:sugar transferase (PEP-CTERM/EpsH1 system associated)
MRLLFLTPHVPFPPNRGGEILVDNLIRRLAPRHEIALVTFYDRREELAHRQVLERYCVHVDMVPRPTKFAPSVLLRTLGGAAYSTSRHMSRAYRATLHTLLRAFRPDIVQVETFVMAQYMANVIAPPTILHMHDVAWSMWNQMSAVAPGYLRPFVRAETRRIHSAEMSAIAQANACVTVSEDDAELLAAEALPRPSIPIVPGVDCDRLAPVPRPTTGRNLLFVGSMNYLPNVDAAVFFVRDVLPLVRAKLPDVTLTIVGLRPPAIVQRLSDKPGIVVTGTVEDVRPYYASAAVAVVPLRMAGGVRMKILEALAFGMPIVSTSIGAQGLGLRNGHELLIADNPADLAAAIVRLISDPSLRSQLASTARAAAEQRFSWTRAVDALESLYGSVRSRLAIPAIENMQAQRCHIP